MNRLLAKTPVYLFIFTLVVITIMFCASNSDYYSTLSNNSRPKSVNVIINDMQLIINNEQGGHQATLVSPKVNHDPKLTITFLQDPVLLINHQDASWKITAKFGKLIHNNTKLRQIEKIILNDDVVILRDNIVQKNSPKDAQKKAPDNNLAFLDLRTSELTYLPKDDLVVTDKKVTITSKESITTAIGLKFNKKTQKLDLLSNVKSIYNSGNPNQQNETKKALNNNYKNNKSHV